MSRIGVSTADVFNALQAQMGSLYVNDFNKSGRTYRVTMQADADYRSKPEHIGAWLNPEGRPLSEMYAIFDDKQHPYYEHQVAKAA